MTYLYHYYDARRVGTYSLKTTRDMLTLGALDSSSTTSKVNTMLNLIESIVVHILNSRMKGRLCEYVTNSNLSKARDLISSNNNIHLSACMETKNSDGLITIIIAYYDRLELTSVFLRSFNGKIERDVSLPSLTPLSLGLLALARLRVQKIQDKTKEENYVVDLTDV